MADWMTARSAQLEHLHFLCVCVRLDRMPRSSGQMSQVVDKIWDDINYCYAQETYKCVIG